MLSDVLQSWRIAKSDTSQFRDEKIAISVFDFIMSCNFYHPLLASQSKMIGTICMN